MLPLSFDNGWTDRSATVDEKNPTAKNLVNFCPVTPEILWLICIGSDFREANTRAVLGLYAG